MRIACLHTADSNKNVFEAAQQQLGHPDVTLSHEVRSDLLAAAARAGGLTPEIARATGEVLLELGTNADAVLLTCSTLGPSIDGVVARARVPVLRVDDALAREATREGGRVVVLCTAETTLGPTRDLFERAGRTTGAEIDVRLVDGAWSAFQAGDADSYFSMIADAAEQAMRAGATTVVLAQASMAGAAKLCKSAKAPLASPLVGLEAAVRLAGG